MSTHIVDDIETAERIRRAHESAVNDAPTVRDDGTRIERLIDGVVVRHAITQMDDRGEMTELCESDWLTPRYAILTPPPTQSWFRRKPYAPTRWMRAIVTPSDGDVSLGLATS